MNTLSWFLYLASVSGQITFVIRFFVIISLLAMPVIILILSVWAGDNSNSREHKEELYNLRDRVLKMVWIPIIMAVLVSFIPDTQTMYMIAGSELGETAITSPEAKSIYDDIREVIKSYSNVQGQ